MLLSLGGELIPNIAQNATAVGFAAAPVQYSAQIAVATPESTSTSVSVSLLPTTSIAPEADGQASTPRQIASDGEMSLAIVSRPAIFLRDQEGNILSSLDGPPSSNEVYTGYTPPTEGDPAILDEQAEELTPDGLAKLPKVPWSLETSIHGSLSSIRGWMSFKIPVGPNTGVLQLAVRPEHDGESSTAMVDQIYLVGANGTVVASLTGVASLTTDSRQTLIVTLQSAPQGGTLVIRVVQPSAATLAAPTDGSDSSDSSDTTDGSDASDGSDTSDPSGGLGALTPPPTTPTDFEVDINRDDPLPQPPGEPSGPPPVVLPPGSYLPSAPGSAPAHVSVGPATNTQNNTSINFEPGYAPSTSNWTASVSGASASIDVETESESISLGPLVSRGSAPMGPALATSIDDPAPSINRDDQGGRDPAVGRPEGGGVELMLKMKPGGGDADRTADRRLDPRDSDADTAEDDRAPLTTLKGLGGLPLLVASFHGRQGASHAEELAATLRQSADQADGLVPADEGLPVSSTEREDRRDEIAKAGIATRAVGFIVALGLATGPLYPDLVALARRRLARKRRVGSPIIATTARRFFRRRSPRPIS